jgi:hypothetical protein
MLNIISDPFGNLIGRPVVRAGMFAHDALAPYTGATRFTDEDRRAMLDDTVPQPGTRIANRVGAWLGAPSPESVAVTTPSEGWARAAAAGALGGIPFGFGTAAIGAAGAPLSQEAAQRAGAAAPEWAKPYVEPAAAGAAALALPVAGRTAAGGLGMAARAALVPRDAELQRLLQYAQQQDIPATVGGVTQSPFAKTMDSVLRSVPGSGYAGLDAEMQSAINRAANRTMGLDAQTLRLANLPDDKVTGAHFNLAHRLSAGEMQRIESTYPLRLDPQLGADLRAIIGRFNPSTIAQHEATAIESSLTQFLDTALENQRRSGIAGEIPGTVYGNFVHTGAPIESAIGSTSPNMRRANTEILRALQDAYTRSLPANEAGAYHAARVNYSNKEALSPIAGRADVPGGAHPSTGDIVPEQLRGIVNRARGGPEVAYLNPGDDRLNDLAQLTQRLKQPRSSNTSERSFARRTLEGIPHIVTALGAAAMERGAMPEFMHPTTVGPTLLGAGALGFLARGLGAGLRTPALPEGTFSQRLGRAVTDSLPAAVAGAAGGAETPTINPATGLPQYNLADAQAANAASGHPLVSGLLASGAKYSDWVRAHRAGIIREFGGQGFQRMMQLGASLSRGNTILRSMVDLFNSRSGLPPMLSHLGVRSPDDLILAAVRKSGLANVLSGPSMPNGRVSNWALKQVAKAIGGDTGT